MKIFLINAICESVFFLIVWIALKVNEDDAKLCKTPMITWLHVEAWILGLFFLKDLGLSGYLRYYPDSLTMNQL